MRQPKRNLIQALTLGLGFVFVFGALLVAPTEARTRMGPEIPMATPPGVVPQSLPQADERGGSSLSVDAQANGTDYMKFEPYNTFPREMNLWGLEKERFIRSIPVLSPEKSVMAYTEVLFMANIRQTIAKMYLVKVPPPPVLPQPHLPSEDTITPPAPPPDPKLFQARFDPDKTMQVRQSIAQVGHEQVKPFDFKTLTIVDWSASGRKFLFKERKGVLHVGLRVTDILVYDEEKGTVTIYPEVQRVIKHYWMTQQNLPNMDSLVWEVQPLGWEPASDSNVLLKAWAYDKQEKKFLGLWRYDVDAERTTLLQTTDDPAPVAANGWIATPVPIPPPPDPPAWKKYFRRHPFSSEYSFPTPAPGIHY